MHRLTALCRRFAWVPSVAMTWLLLVGTALAADEAGPAPVKNNWVMAYILVVLGIGLGLVAVLRLGKRSKELTREEPE